MFSNSVCNHMIDFFNLLYDYRPNWISLSPITITSQMHTCACDILSSLVSQFYTFTQYIQIHPLGTYLEEQIIQKLVNDLFLTCDLKTLLT